VVHRRFPCLGVRRLWFGQSEPGSRSKRECCAQFRRGHHGSRTRRSRRSDSGRNGVGGARSGHGPVRRKREVLHSHRQQPRDLGLGVRIQAGLRARRPADLSAG
jgi:hypothetical protein